MDLTDAKVAATFYLAAPLTFKRGAAVKRDELACEIALCIFAVLYEIGRAHV